MDIEIVKKEAVFFIKAMGDASEDAKSYIKLLETSGENTCKWILASYITGISPAKITDYMDMYGTALDGGKLLFQSLYAQIAGAGESRNEQASIEELKNMVVKITEENTKQLQYHRDSTQEYIKKTKANAEKMENSYRKDLKESEEKLTESKKQLAQKDRRIALLSMQLEQQKKAKQTQVAESVAEGQEIQGIRKATTEKPNRLDNSPDRSEGSDNVAGSSNPTDSDTSTHHTKHSAFNPTDLVEILPVDLEPLSQDKSNQEVDSNGNIYTQNGVKGKAVPDFGTKVEQSDVKSRGWDLFGWLKPIIHRGKTRKTNTGKDKVKDKVGMKSEAEADYKLFEKEVVNSGLYDSEMISFLTNLMETGHYRYHDIRGTFTPEMEPRTIADVVHYKRTVVPGMSGKNEKEVG